MPSAYDLLLPPGINRLTRLCVKSANSITVSKHLKKLLQIKKMHGLHNMFYFGRWKYSCSVFTVFIFGNLSTQCSFSFLADFLSISCFLEKALAIVTKCSALDVAGVLNPLQYVPTWTACANNLIKCLAKGSNWSFWVQCMTIIYQSAKTWSIGEVVYELTTK